MKKICFCILFLMSFLTSVFAFEPFVLKKIEVEGLQRISKPAVIRDMPIRYGEILTPEKTPLIIQALFKTGFFKQIELHHVQNTLIVKVKERPSIGQLTITGISEKKPIIKILKEQDIQEGRMFDQAKLTKAQRQIERYYLMNGRYGVKINAIVEKQSRNRIKLKIEIYEGDVARIREIKIIGTQAFSERQLLKELHTTKKTWISWLTKSDRYAKEKLGADLETLQSYYMDRGYIHFQIDSTQVSLSTDKKDIYIAIHITEGEKYYFGETKVLGDHPISSEKMKQALSEIQPEAVFSRKKLRDTKEQIEKLMGNEGYYFAEVRPSHEVNALEKIVNLTYFVTPGDKIYVRHIFIQGNHTTQDEVLRRELMQMEGSPISRARVDNGKESIERAGFAQEVQVNTLATDIKDQVDVAYTFEEQRLGQVMAGINFSPGSGFGVEASASQRNFFGTGKSGNVSFSKTRTSSAYGVGYFDPYYTIDKIGFGMQGFYNRTNLSKVSATSEYLTDSFGGKVYWVIPLSPYEAFSFGSSYEDLEIKSAGGRLADEIQNFIDTKGSRFREWSIMLGLTYDSLDKFIFPTQGFRQDLGAHVIVPGSRVEYYKLTYDMNYFYPLIKEYILKFQLVCGYADGYRRTKALPFFRNFYAGGVDSVRGFDERTLGPKDSKGDALGGNALLSGRMEFIFPNPIKPEVKTIRTSVFLDAGQVYDTHIKGGKSFPMKFSTGFALAWNSPLGAPLLFSLGFPINYKKGEDNKRVFGFSFSGAF